MSYKIGALVIAEGAETEDEAIQILRLGGHMIQGFFFSEPQQYTDVASAFTNHKVDLLSKRFNEHMKRQHLEESSRNKRLYAAAVKAVRCLEMAAVYEFDDSLLKIISENQTMECAYILDKDGIQVSHTISAPEISGCGENLIFYSARKGTDHSMEKYYYPLVSAGIKRHITQPYISMATGNLCITISMTFKNKENNTYILCVDFHTNDAVNDIELKNPIRNFSDGSRHDMVGMLNRMNEGLIIDSLTKAFNRRYIEERLLIDVFNATNEDQSISIILTDIDHFKSINDRYGHLAGDAVLKEFVQIAKRFIRKNTDWVARYGGDEFLVVLVNADETAARKVAEKIRTAVEKTLLLYETSTVCFTASFGTYTVHSKKMTCDQLISRADKNLYLAKTAGRNQVADTIKD